MVPEHVLQETLHQARGAHPLSILGGQVSVLGTGHVLLKRKSTLSSFKQVTLNGSESFTNGFILILSVEV